MEAIWNKVQTSLKAQVPSHSYRMWIEPIKYVKSERQQLVLSAPNLFMKKRIQDHYTPLITSELLKQSGKKYRFTLKVADTNAPNDSDELSVSPQKSLPDVDYLPHCGRRLRKDFTFDQFVVDENNNFAYSAALSQAVQENLNQTALLLLSKTGMGKSHLSQAIGHYVLSRYPNDRVFYITAEDFTNEMVHAFRSDTFGQFKEKYRNQCDVLLMEDVHFLSGKERTQFELATTLDALFDSGKKIIFTSCFTPADIPKISDQLRSRLCCGLISKIEPPNFKTRVRILVKKSKRSGYNIPKDVADYLAGELSDDVRQLESGLIGVIAKSSLLGEPIDVSLAESVVQTIVRRRQSITIDVIKKLVSKQYGITIKDLISRSRKKSVVRPRQVAIYLARQHTDSSLQAIGKSFNRYHATALHSIAAVENELKANGPLQKQVDILNSKLDAGKF